MIWENGTETCIISHMKQVASPGSMHDTGCLGLVHWDDPEGWYGEGGGTRVNQYNIVKLKNTIKYIITKKNIKKFFFYTVGCLFILLMVSFAVQKVFSLMPALLIFLLPLLLMSPKNYHQDLKELIAYVFF